MIIDKEMTVWEFLWWSVTLVIVEQSPSQLPAVPAQSY